MELVGKIILVVIKDSLLYVWLSFRYGIKVAQLLERRFVSYQERAEI